MRVCKHMRAQLPVNHIYGCHATRTSARDRIMTATENYTACHLFLSPLFNSGPMDPEGPRGESNPREHNPGF